MLHNRSITTLTISKFIGSCILVCFAFVVHVFAQNCTQWPGGTINDGETVLGHSSVLRAITWQDYTNVSCTSFQWLLTCVGGVITQNNPAIYPYSLAQCQAGTPKSCNQRAGGSIPHGQTMFWYSTTWASYPKTCADFATELSCTNGNIDGNYQTYKYTSTQCRDLNQLVAGVDLAINESTARNQYKIAQWSRPKIDILFQSKWDTLVNQSNVAAWFLSCLRKEKNIVIYTSKPLTTFSLQPGAKLWVSITINAIFTQALGNKTIVCTMHPSVATLPDVNTTNNTRMGTFEVVNADRFDLALSTSISSISKNLEAAEWANGTQWLKNFIFEKVMNVLVPLIVILWILSAILGFYKLMFSSEDAARKEGINYIVFGVIGIVLIMSAKFLGQNIYDILSVSDISWSTTAVSLYNTIIYPFIKFAIYLVLGAMFVILVSRVITFLFGSDTDAVKKAGTLIGWNVISMLVIIGAKQIVEAVYGKQADVVQEVTNLWEIWSGILADKNIPILYQVINYALGIASLVILVVIIIQTVKLLMKPDDAAQLKSIKNSLLYMFIGILIIGLWYLIVNFAIFN